MKLKDIHCPCCGANSLEKESGDTYVCAYCGHTFEDEGLQKDLKKLEEVFGQALTAQKEEQIAAARSELYAATHEEYLSTKKVQQYAHELKKLLPDDFQANFYESAITLPSIQLTNYLDDIDVEENHIYLSDAVEFMIRCLESKTVLPLENLVERASKEGVFSNDEYVAYMSAIEDEAEKFENGLYSAIVPRDVFVAYSSADMKKVNEVVTFLEGNEITCFVAARNLRHGKGSKENYEKLLEQAMNRCKCVLFLSSTRSRSLSCDALKIELPYIRDNVPNMGRVEYLLEPYDNRTTMAAKHILKDFFGGLEYCRDEETLLKRIIENVTKSKQDTTKKEAGKYCSECGEFNSPQAVVCKQCGNNTFVATKEEVDNRKTLIEKAYSLALLEKFKEARRIYETLIDKEPKNIVGYMGIIRVETKNYTLFEGALIDKAIRAARSVAQEDNLTEFDPDFKRYFDYEQKKILEAQKQEERQKALVESARKIKRQEEIKKIEADIASLDKEINQVETAISKKEDAYSLKEEKYEERINRWVGGGDRDSLDERVDGFFDSSATWVMIIMALVTIVMAVLLIYYYLTCEMVTIGIAIGWTILWCLIPLAIGIISYITVTDGW